MAKKLFTLGVDEKNLKSSKNVESTAREILKKKNEVEEFGIAQINNSSSVKKVTSKVDRGFEKNVVETKRHAVKSTVSKVDDYFDFSFKTDTKKKSDKIENKLVSEQADVEKTNAAKVYKTQTIDSEFESRKANIAKEACERSLDDEAYAIMYVARMGSLFDCEKRMIQM